MKPKIILHHPEALYDRFENRVFVKCFSPELSMMVTIGEVRGGIYEMADGRIFHWSEKKLWTDELD